MVSMAVSRADDGSTDTIIDDYLDPYVVIVEGYWIDSYISGRRVADEVNVADE